MIAQSNTLAGRITRVSVTLVACAVFLVSFSGCASQDINAWPVYYQDSEPVEGGTGDEAGVSTTRDVLWPLFTEKDEPGRHYHVVRPLYNYESKDEGVHSRLQYLWPLGVFYRREGDVWQHRFFPIFSYHSLESQETGGETVNGWVFPILFWGSRPEQGDGYFAVFPVGGVLKGILGDSFSFVLFPLFSQYKSGDYTRYDVLWPFFSWGSTPDGKRTTFRAWPFYVHKRDQGKFERHYVMWPFVRWGRHSMQSPYPHRVFQFFPFYALKTAKDDEGNVVAYHRQILFVGRIKETREGMKASGWSFFWSLLRFWDGPTSDETRIFPLFWKKTLYGGRSKDPSESWIRYRMPWPIVWLDYNSMNPGVDKRSFVIAPIYWDYRRTYHEDEGDEKYRAITLWPLLTWRTDRDDAFHFWMLSHGWEDAPEGYKRNYRAFFDLFQYHSRPEGDTMWAVLWRLLRYESGSEGTDWNIMGLFDYGTDYRDGKLTQREISTLFGLLKYTWKPEDTEWRVFFIPI